MKNCMAVCIVLLLFLSACDSQGPVAPELKSEGQLNVQEGFSKAGTVENGQLDICKLYPDGENGPEVTFTVDAVYEADGSQLGGYPQDVVLGNGACAEFIFPDPGKFLVTVTEHVPAGYAVSFMRTYIDKVTPPTVTGPFTDNPTTQRVTDDNGILLVYTNAPLPEGCTPGYWKNHLSAWAATGYSPTDDFDTIFGVNFFDPDVDLLTALSTGGGGVYRAGRHGTAALLSAAHPDVDYPYTVAEVIAMVQAGNIDALAMANEGFCPL